MEKFYANGNILFDKPIKVMDGWELINDMGYIYMTFAGKFFDINMASGFNSPLMISKTKKVKQEVWLDEDKIKEEDKKKYSKRWDSKKGISRYYKIIEKDVVEQVEADEPRGLISWHYDKPSISFIYEAAKIAGQIYNELSAEVEVLVVYDSSIDDYKMIIPTQTVSGASCEFTYDELKLGVQELIVDIHSHHTMGCSYSGTDDNDDNDKIMSYHPHLSVVIKNIREFDFSNLEKNVDIRLTFRGYTQALKLSDVFEMTMYKLPQVKKAVTKIESYKYNFKNYGYPLGAKGKAHVPIYDDYGYDDYNDPWMSQIPTPKGVDALAKLAKKNINAVQSSLFTNPKNKSLTITIDDIKKLTSADIAEIIMDLNDKDKTRLRVTFNNNIPNFLVAYFTENPDIFYSYFEEEEEMDRLDKSLIDTTIKNRSKGK